MFSRNPLAFRQEFARPTRCGIFAFARMAGLSDDCVVQGSAALATCRTRECYPFLSPRPGPMRVGPSFCTQVWRVVAYTANTRSFWFEIARNVVNCQDRTTNQRGGSPCVNLSSFFHWQFCRLPAAFSPIRPRPALGLALFRVRHLARSRITRLQNRLWSVAHSERLLATQAFAADLAAPTIYFGIKASCGQSATGFSHFARHRAVKERKPCSKRS